MIARIRGRIWEKDLGRVVLDCGGVGYELLISLSSAALLGAEGETAELHVTTIVREDSFQLFGFAQIEERMLFQLLISVSGIGPKTAIAALSSMPAAEFAAAVATSDLVRLTRVQGIGKKTAERLVVELRDKVTALRAAAGPGVSLLPAGGVKSNALDALIALGYSRNIAERAVQEIEAESLTVQDIIKMALQKLSGKR